MPPQSGETKPGWLEMEWIAGTLGPEFVTFIVAIARKLNAADPKDLKVWEAGDFEMPFSERGQDDFFNTELVIRPGGDVRNKKLLVDIAHSATSTKPKADPDVVFQMVQMLVEGALKGSKKTDASPMQEFATSIKTLKKHGLKAIVITGTGQRKQKTIAL